MSKETGKHQVNRLDRSLHLPSCLEAVLLKILAEMFSNRALSSTVP